MIMPYPFAVALASLLLMGSAFAQNVQTGTVRATVDGEERTWFTVLFEGEETGLPTATWGDVMNLGRFTTFAIQAHPELRYAVEGALSIEFTIFEPMPPDCPCTIADANVTLWTRSAMLESVYVGDDATVIVERVEEIEDGVFVLEGTFEARLVFHADVMAEGDPNDAIDIAGSFLIDRLPRDTSGQ